MEGYRLTETDKVHKHNFEALLQLDIERSEDKIGYLGLEANL